MKPSKVLYVSRTVQGGVGVVLNQMSRGIDRSRYEPVIVLDETGWEKINDNPFHQEIKTIILNNKTKSKNTKKIKSLRSKDVGTKLQEKYGTEARDTYAALKKAYLFILKQSPTIQKYIKVIRENNIKIIHTHCELIHGKAEILASKITGVPCVCHIHGYYNLTYFDKIFDKFVDKYIYISNHVAEQYEEQIKCNNKGVVIHNGIDTTLYDKEVDTNMIRSELQLKPSDILVCIIGRIVHWKGHDYFIKAIEKVSKKLTNVKGVIVGEVEKDEFDINQKYFVNLKKIIFRLNIKDKIIFVGFRKDVARIIKAMDIIVHASSTPEPFGLVILEGMASGKPVVATNTGGVVEIIENGVNGRLFPSKDSKALATAIIEIINDNKKGNQLGENAKKFVNERFSIARQMSAIQEIYDTILNQCDGKKGKYK